MEITGLSEVGVYDFEEDDNTLEDTIWNGRDVRIMKNYQYSPGMQRFQFAPNLIQDSSVINCKTNSSVGLKAEVSKEPGKKTEGSFAAIYETRSEDGRSKARIKGEATTNGEAKISAEITREF